jgi:hypothetical protein
MDTPDVDTIGSAHVPRKELHEKIDALPCADRTSIVTEPTNAEPISTATTSRSIS